MSKPEQGRRGRTAKCPEPADGPVAEFAHRLWALKRAAGDPSYDRMREELGALASKSALSAAGRGDRLPSWDTAWEFVRVLAVGVLGQDVEPARQEWRAHWERARDGETLPRAEVSAVAEPARRRRWPALLAAGIAAALLAAVGVILLTEQKEPAVDVPPAALPVVNGDISEYVADVTLPDGVQVPTGTQLIKTWELRNAGSVPWVGRYLKRAGSFGSPDECTTPEQVPIPDTRPGETVRVSVDLRTPDTAGHCHVYWKMTDEQGRLLLPGSRGLYFLVTVTG